MPKNNRMARSGEELNRRSRHRIRRDGENLGAGVHDVQSVSYMPETLYANQELEIEKRNLMRLGREARADSRWIKPETSGQSLSKRGDTLPQ